MEFRGFLLLKQIREIEFHGFSVVSQLFKQTFSMTKRARGWCGGTDEVDRAIAAACDEDSVFKLRYAVGEIGGDDPCERQRHRCAANECED